MRIILATFEDELRPSSSATSLDTETLSPAEANATAVVYTDMVSSYIPIPSAPNIWDKNIIEIIPMVRVKKDVAVNIRVLTISVCSFIHELPSANSKVGQKEFIRSLFMKSLYVRIGENRTSSPKLSIAFKRST